MYLLNTRYTSHCFSLLAIPILSSKEMASMNDIITESTKFVSACYGQPTLNKKCVTWQQKCASLAQQCQYWLRWHLKRIISWKHKTRLNLYIQPWCRPAKYGSMWIWLSNESWNGDTGSCISSNRGSFNTTDSTENDKMHLLEWQPMFDTMAQL